MVTEIANLNTVLASSTKGQLTSPGLPEKWSHVLDPRPIYETHVGWLRKNVGRLACETWLKLAALNHKKSVADYRDGRVILSQDTGFGWLSVTCSRFIFSAIYRYFDLKYR